MTSNPVDSSFIARIGYDPDISLLAVFFKDGGFVTVASVSPAEFAAFMAAPSKGTHFHAHFGAAAQKFRGVTPGSQSIELREPEPITKLETFGEDECCARRLQKARRDGLNQWSCPKCGTVWNKKDLGAVYHWEPEVASFVLRISGS